MIDHYDHHGRLLDEPGDAPAPREGRCPRCHRRHQLFWSAETFEQDWLCANCMRNLGQAEDRERERDRMEADEAAVYAADQAYYASMPLADFDDVPF